MDFKKLKYAGIVLSILSFAFSLLVLAFWLLGTIKISTIDAQTYISIIITLLSILVTFVIGWQIFNVLDVKSSIKQLDIKNKEQEELISRNINLLENKIHKYSENLNKQAIYLESRLFDVAFEIEEKTSFSSAQSFILNGHWEFALDELFRVFESIINQISYDAEKKKEDFILKMMNECVDYIDEKGFSELRHLYESKNARIKECKNYKYVQDKYELFYNRLMTKY